ncbi:MAG: thiolase family protein [Proteobacteria bacterium]|nr:thiolase family protein [Pseudomonadota bacterium]MDA1300410.1 thiolase family protein [Pseudomonadota bacterium]
MGLQGRAAITGVADFKNERKYTGKRKFYTEQWAELTQLAITDAGLSKQDIDGLCCASIPESSMFAPATIAEYLGLRVNFAEMVDLGGASSVSMIWRAAAAIELGLCEAVVCAAPGLPIPSNPNPPRRDPTRLFGSVSANWGSPQTEFDVPYGNVAQNAGYALIAQRYAATYGYDERALAKIAADQRTNAQGNPNAVFYGQPITIDDVLQSKMIADPLHILEIVMPCAGGCAVVVVSDRLAKKCRHRPVHITGCGEHLTTRSVTYAEDMTVTPVGPAAASAFRMSGKSPRDIDVLEAYDCYTITVLLTIEDSGFCNKGEGIAFVNENDLTFAGSFPVNTHGGQLGAGQAAGMAGGMSQPVEGVRQIMGRAEGRQVPHCDTALVTGTGGIMSEQSAIILEGA